MGFPDGSTVKNPPAKQETQGDVGSIPGSERLPGGRNVSPLHYSCLERKNLWTEAPGRLQSMGSLRVGQD